MFDATDLRHLPKPELYDDLARQLDGLLHGERDAIANLANASALIFQSLPDLNWAGFYLMKDGDVITEELEETLPEARPTEGQAPLPRPGDGDGYYAWSLALLARVAQADLRGPGR